jgi:hypothetical protein
MLKLCKNMGGSKGPLGGIGGGIDWMEESEEICVDGAEERCDCGERIDGATVDDIGDGRGGGEASEREENP